MYLEWPQRVQLFIWSAKYRKYRLTTVRHAFNGAFVVRWIPERRYTPSRWRLQQDRMFDTLCLKRSYTAYGINGIFGFVC